MTLPDYMLLGIKDGLMQILCDEFNTSNMLLIRNGQWHALDISFPSSGPMSIAKESYRRQTKAEQKITSFFTESSCGM